MTVVTLYKQRDVAVISTDPALRTTWGAFRRGTWKLDQIPDDVRELIAVMDLTEETGGLTEGVFGTKEMLACGEFAYWLNAAGWDKIKRLLL
jgi:hypothetical protein